MSCGAAPPAVHRAPAQPSTIAPTAAATVEPHVSPCVAGSELVEAGEVESETLGLRCCTYLRRREKAKKVSRVVFVQGGTGIYTAARGALGPVAEQAIESADTALLTMDKPGIHANEHGQMVFDPDTYRKYTLADLTACGRNAIAWASQSSLVDIGASLTLHGHSEGGQMMVRVLASSPSSRLQRVERMILSGLLMEPFADATLRQIAIFMPFEIEAYQDALRRGDDNYLLHHALSTKYLSHPTAHESLEPALNALANQRPRFPIDVFHGDHDINAPLADVTRFATLNETARKEGRPALDWRLHVYRGGRHDLTRDRRFEADVRALRASSASPALHPQSAKM